MDVDVELTAADIIEAHIRRKMAAHAAIQPRGFDTIAQRARIHAEIDELYDELAWVAPHR